MIAEIKNKGKLFGESGRRPSLQVNPFDLGPTNNKREPRSLESSLLGSVVERRLAGCGFLNRQFPSLAPVVP